MSSDSVSDEDILSSPIKSKSHFKNRSRGSGGVDMASVRIKELQGV